MQDYLEAKHPTLCADTNDGMSNESDSNDGYVVETITGQKRNLILLNHSSVTSTGPNGQG